LLEALGARIEQFDTVIAGPYLFGLTYDVACEFADKTLLVPCFHNEPAAKLPALINAYEQVGGILYHSPEEQRLAESELGLNHPRATCMGTFLDMQQAGNPLRGEEQVGTGRRYVLYAGRYSPHKNLPLLLKYARRYWTRHPDRFTFAFIGQGDLAIPNAPWAKDLGFVDERTRRDLIAGAEAVVQLSRMESLSLVALEAWAQGVPMIVDRHCAVLAAQVHRCKGGAEVSSYDAFALALDDLWETPQRWQALGRQAQDYVREHFGSREAFTRQLEQAINGLHVPLREPMRQLGLQRAQGFRQQAWRERFAQIVDDVLHAVPRPLRQRVEVRPRAEQREVAAGLQSLLVPVRVYNQGSHALVAEGPARTVLRCRVLDESGKPVGPPAAEIPLPSLVLPGRAVPAAITVPVPDRPGTYQVAFRAERAVDESGKPVKDSIGAVSPVCCLRLVVTAAESRSAVYSTASFIEAVQAAMVQATKLQQLPDDYNDVTEGWFAYWKRRIKSKLLNNFKRAYADVVSRQQSAFNRQMLTVLQELVECCATLEHAQQQVRNQQPQVNSERGTTNGQPKGKLPMEHSVFIRFLADELAQSKQRCSTLEERLTRLEALMQEREKLSS
jgi:hypothetical protein